MPLLHQPSNAGQPGCRHLAGFASPHMVSSDAYPVAISCHVSMPKDISAPTCVSDMHLHHSHDCIYHRNYA